VTFLIVVVNFVKWRIAPTFTRLFVSPRYTKIVKVAPRMHRKFPCRIFAENWCVFPGKGFSNVSISLSKLKGVGQKFFNRFFTLCWKISAIVPIHLFCRFLSTKKSDPDDSAQWSLTTASQSGCEFESNVCISCEDILTLLCWLALEVIFVLVACLWSSNKV
jgi:hypothetical protein